MAARRALTRYGGRTRLVAAGDTLDPALFGANLQSLAGLTGAANKGVYFTAAGAMSLYDLVAALSGSQLYSVSGSANAIVLTASMAAPTAYTDGMIVRAKITTTNTNATTVNVNGLGVKTCTTSTGVNLPPGYIRTDRVTEMRYDSISGFFVVDRETETFTNGNGTVTRYADGSQKCEKWGLSIGTVDVVAGQIFRSGTVVWTFPAEFADLPSVSPGTCSDIRLWGSNTATITAASIRLHSWVSIPTTVQTVNVVAHGRWYS